MKNKQIPTASILPLILTALFLVASAALYFLRFQLANDFFFVLGYLLAPIGVTGTLAWDIWAQRKGQMDPNFDVRPSYTKIIKLLVALGYVVGILHILELGRMLGELVVQSGVN